MLHGSLVKTVTSDGLELAGFWSDQKLDVAVFHSHGTAGDFYTHQFIETEGSRLAELGISFLTANNRGHDVYADIRKHQNESVGWTNIGGAFEKFEDCLFDVGAWLDFLSAQGVKKVILQAHSLTQKILYYQHIKKDPRVIGQIHLSPCNDAGFMLFLLGEEKYKRTNERIARLVEEGKTTNLLEKELAVVCPMAPLPYFGYLTEDGVGNLFPYHDPTSLKWSMLEGATDPLLAIFGGADGFIKPSIDEAAGLFKSHARSSRDTSVEIIPDAPHSYVGFEDRLVDALTKWIQTR
ncbi:MAG: hypothetical protein NUV84_00075 [Candidatus Uhrbacteria bacterium]|nr:hypothetical protein [Candidatus Uhrbacteria bacterium]